METNFWIESANIGTGVITGGGLLAVIKARVDKKKTPYDMSM